jgi:hypothetical protein
VKRWSILFDLPYWKICVLLSKFSFILMFCLLICHVSTTCLKVDT